MSWPDWLTGCRFEMRSILRMLSALTRKCHLCCQLHRAPSLRCAEAEILQRHRRNLTLLESRSPCSYRNRKDCGHSSYRSAKGSSISLLTCLPTVLWEVSDDFHVWGAKRNSTVESIFQSEGASLWAMMRVLFVFI